MPLELIDIANEKTIEQLDYNKKVMAEEVLHKNPGAKILPTQPVPDELPPVLEMIRIRHKTCGDTAFYYTHVPQTAEMMTAVRSRDIDGNPIEPGAPMMCGSCGENCGPRSLMVNKTDFEAAHGKD